MPPVGDLNVPKISLKPSQLGLSVESRMMGVNQKSLREVNMPSPRCIVRSLLSNQPTDVVGDILWVRRDGAPAVLVEARLESLLCCPADIQEDIAAVDMMRTVNLINSEVCGSVEALDLLQGVWASPIDVDHKVDV